MAKIRKERPLQIRDQQLLANFSEIKRPRQVGPPYRRHFQLLAASLFDGFNRAYWVVCNKFWSIIGHRVLLDHPFWRV